MTAPFNGFAPLCLSITLRPVSDHRSAAQQDARIVLVPKLEADATSSLTLAPGQSRKKKCIPKKMREMVWDKYIGESIAVSPCWCCQSTNIKNTDFVCGHVIAESCGGDTNVDNMRPICSMCNLSMGTKNMHEFMKLLGKKPRDDISAGNGDSLWKHLSLVGLKSACEFFGRDYKAGDSRQLLATRLCGTDSSVFLLQMLANCNSPQCPLLKRFCERAAERMPLQWTCAAVVRRQVRAAPFADACGLPEVEPEECKRLASTAVPDFCVQFSRLLPGQIDTDLALPLKTCFCERVLGRRHLGRPE